MEEKRLLALEEKMARACARWWRERVDGRARHDNGGEDMASMMAGAMMDTRRKPATAAQLDKFEEVLTVLLVNASLRKKNLRVECDYHPCPILSQAAEKAGISPLSFPLKTVSHLSFRAGVVTVYDGYGHGPEVLLME